MEEADKLVTEALVNGLLIKMLTFILILLFLNLIFNLLLLVRALPSGWALPYTTTLVSFGVLERRYLAPRRSHSILFYSRFERMGCCRGGQRCLRHSPLHLQSAAALNPDLESLQQGDNIAYTQFAWFRL